MKKAENRFPLCATVSRKDGTVRIEWGEGLKDAIRFGAVMNRIGEEALISEDAERKEAHRRKQAESA